MNFKLNFGNSYGCIFFDKQMQSHNFGLMGSPFDGILRRNSCRNGETKCGGPVSK